MRHYRRSMIRETIHKLLTRFIPLRPWVALVLLLIGLAITIPAFKNHSLWLALAGAPFLGGALGILLIPLPYPR
ncbi:MAG: hypothetical protein P8Y29_03015 [Gemmatimonadota bacterium]|jgi:hypothetical protein